MRSNQLSRAFLAVLTISSLALPVTAVAKGGSSYSGGSSSRSYGGSSYGGGSSRSYGGSSYGGSSRVMAAAHTAAAAAAALLMVAAPTEAAATNLRAIVINLRPTATAVTNLLPAGTTQAVAVTPPQKPALPNRALGAIAPVPRGRRLPLLTLQPHGQRLRRRGLRLRRRQHRLPEPRLIGGRVRRRPRQALRNRKRLPRRQRLIGGRDQSRPLRRNTNAAAKVQRSSSASVHHANEVAFDSQVEPGRLCTDADEGWRLYREPWKSRSEVSFRRHQRIYEKRKPDGAVQEGRHEGSADAR